MAATNTYCANGHAVPAGERTCPVCGAPAVSKGAARRNAALAGLVALGLIGGGAFGIHHLVTRNNAPPETAEVVAVQPVEPTGEQDAGNQGAEQAPPDQGADAAPPAQAAPPAAPDTQLVDSAMVRDETGLLSGNQAQLATALNQVADQTPYRLFVVYVNSFDGMDSVQWANRAATQAGLGHNDLLLAVAVGDQEYGLSFDNNIQLNNNQLNQIQSAIETELGRAARGQADWSMASSPPRNR